MQPKILGYTTELAELTEISRQRELINVRNLLIASVLVYACACTWDFVVLHPKHPNLLYILAATSSFNAWRSYKYARFLLFLDVAMIGVICWVALKYGTLLGHPEWLIFAIALGMNTTAIFRL